MQHESFPFPPVADDASDITRALANRPGRQPDHAAEGLALVELARDLAEDEDSVLQSLCDAALKLCRADGSGISLIEENPGASRFVWSATSGVFQHYLGGSMPRHGSPCGIVVDRNAPQLMAYPAHRFPGSVKLDFEVTEILLVPFRRGKRPIGTLWVVATTPDQHFDAEDVRLLTSLSHFASAALLSRDKSDAAKTSERDLSEASSRLDAALDAGAIATWTWDITANRLVADANLARLFSVAPEDAAGGKLEAYLRAIHPDDLERVTARIAQVAEHGGRYDEQYRIVQPDGDHRWVEAKGKGVADATGKIVTLPGVIVDITERKRIEAEHLAAEEAVIRSESRFRALVNASSDAVYRMSPDWSEMYSLQSQDFIADTADADPNWIAKYIHLDDHSRVKVAISQAIATRGVFELEHRVLRTDGSLGWTHSRAVPILDADGRIVEWYGMATDITDSKSSQELIRQSEDRYRTLFTSIDEGFCVFEMIRDDAGSPVDYRFLEVNPAFEEQTGLHHAVGKRMRELAPSHEQFWFDIYGRVAATGEPARFEHDATALEGRIFTVHAFRVGNPAEQKVAVIFSDISHRKRAERERELLVNRLTDADRRKDEFLAMLAHELRNPLGAISSGVMLAKTVQKPEVLDQIKDMIDRQTRHLTHLIDDLLDVSRVATGKVVLKKQTVELDHALARAIDQVRPVVEEKRHELTVTKPDAAVLFVADPTRTEQILGNLLTNAAKYTPAGGRIHLDARQVGNEIVFTVTDNGVGITAEMLPKVFGLFTQIDSSIDRSQGGLGIGLTLVRSLVEMHGGHVAAASAGPGDGSTFTVTFPVGKPEAIEVSSIAPTAIRPSSARYRILIVDDNRDTARMTSRLLAHRGYEMLIAHDGHEGVEAAKAFKPHVLLLDIGLPGMNGYEVAATIRNHECCRDTIIVAVSGYGETAARQRSRDAGFNHHLTKPLDFDLLDQILREVPIHEPTA